MLDVGYWMFDAFAGSPRLPTSDLRPCSALNRRAFLTPPRTWRVRGFAILPAISPAMPRRLLQPALQCATTDRSTQKRPHTKVGKTAKQKAEKAIQQEIVRAPFGELFF